MNTQVLRTPWTLMLIPGCIDCGCGRREASTQGEGQLQGTITISGAWALYP